MNSHGIGQRIKNIRLSLGETMEEFGTRFNTSKATVNNWEKERNKPNKASLYAIAKIADITVDELLYGIRADEIEQLKIALSDIKKTTQYPEFFNVSPETERNLLHETVYVLSNFSELKRITSGNSERELETEKMFIEQTFANHFFETHVTNKSAMLKVARSLSKLRYDIMDYFETLSHSDLSENETLVLTLFHENLNIKLYESLLEIIDFALNSLVTLEAQYPEESIGETMELIIHKHKNTTSINKLTLEEFKRQVAFTLLLLLFKKHPELSESEITELAKQKLSQHHEYILDFYNSNYSS